jgi:hypothetical protein
MNGKRPLIKKLFKQESNMEIHCYGYLKIKLIYTTTPFGFCDLPLQLYIG